MKSERKTPLAVRSAIRPECKVMIKRVVSINSKKFKIQTSEVSVASKNEVLFSDYIDTFRALIDEFLNNESGGEFLWLPKTNYLVSQAVRKYLPLIYAGRALIMGSRNEETKEWGTKVLRTTITEDEYK